MLFASDHRKDQVINMKMAGINMLSAFLSRFKELTCNWPGPAHELTNHSEECAHQRNSHSEIMKCLEPVNLPQVEQVQYVEDSICTKVS